MVIAAHACRAGPATGIVNGRGGGHPRQVAHGAAPVSRSAWRGPSAATDTTPSVKGAVAIAAAMLGSPAATVITLPPDIDGPQSGTLAASTSSRARTYREGRPPVGLLAAERHELARLALARAEVAVVEDEHAVAGLVEAPREAIEAHLPRGTRGNGP